MVNKQTALKLLKLVAKGSISLLAYDLIYRLKHPLKQTSAKEVDIRTLEIPLYPNLKWVDELDYESQMNNFAKPFIQQYEYTGQIPVNGMSLSYSFYLKDKHLPTMFIAHGFNEYKEKYQEMVYYFLQLNYNVLVYDARGHGGSRINPSKTLIDISEFDDYVEDLRMVIESVKKTYGVEGPLYLFGHSMGGAVSTMFLRKYPEVFKAAILSSPMLSVDTHPYPRSVTHALARGAQFFNMGQKPIPSQGSNDVVEASTRSSTYRPNPNLTKSQYREKYYFQVRKAAITHPTSGGTLNWLNASMSGLKNTTQKSVLQNINTPILMFRSVEDIIVRADGIYTGATYLPRIELISIPNAGHEIYQEHDEVLRPYFSLIGYYLDQFN
ncbi:alpha/beta fold hydrolase [Aerococcaceae bacterium DSM 111021]|nr:alpha/beta fold hydrolase [Aerococcaceae bacterium DSM 111021]